MSDEVKETNEVPTELKKQTELLNTLVMLSNDVKLRFKTCLRDIPAGECPVDTQAQKKTQLGRIIEENNSIIRAAISNLRESIELCEL